MRDRARQSSGPIADLRTPSASSISVYARTIVSPSRMARTLHDDRRVENFDLHCMLALAASRPQDGFAQLAEPLKGEFRSDLTQCHAGHGRGGWARFQCHPHQYRRTRRRGNGAAGGGSLAEAGPLNFRALWNCPNSEWSRPIRKGGPISKGTLNQYHLARFEMRGARASLEEHAPIEVTTRHRPTSRGSSSASSPAASSARREPR